MIFLIIFYWKKIHQNNKLSFGISFLLGGIIGNLIDRIFRGYVIDFIDFKLWPVFNIADIFVVIGIILVIWYFIKNS